MDREFDGITNTKPNGIIYIVTGAGGGALYDREMTNNAKLWTHAPAENWIPFTAKIISDRHSFTRIETNEKKLTLQQLDAQGNEIDSIIITK
ncbi:MAG TPA: hypothetical protein VFW11_15035 [Cyclobacteriaceae bacterium]|nr:hypothetical protein [Cyclobacteriaceae bacterium]